MEPFGIGSFDKEHDFDDVEHNGHEGSKNSRGLERLGHEQEGRNVLEICNRQGGQTSEQTVRITLRCFHLKEVGVRIRIILAVMQEPIVCLFFNCFLTHCTQQGEAVSTRRGGAGGEEKNSNSKTLFYKDRSLGSVTHLTTSPAKLLMSRYQITAIVYIHIGMNE